MKHHHVLYARLWLFILLSLSSRVAAADAKQVIGLQARHAAGQTFLTFAEIDPLVTTESIAAIRLRDLRRAAEKSGHVRYRVYRSTRPVSTIAGLTPFAELPPLTGWNIDYYGDLRPEYPALRYVVQEGRAPVSPGTGICALNPPEAGDAYYAVAAVVDGHENTALGPGNSLAVPIRESVGQGVPVLQRTERPQEFGYVRQPTLHYFVRWESPPNCPVQGKPIDYLVAVPEQLAEPAPVGIHLHCWGGSLNGGYGWWYQAEQGHLLLASNQVPYDWWTGYHERYWDGPADQARWEQGVVRPYSQRRLLSFLDWMATRWQVDLTRTHVAGSSMGGSGAPMFAIRHPERIAWAVSWVGVHRPRLSPTFRSSYANVYGQPEWNVKFEDGTPVWDYFDDTWYLRKNPQAEIGLIAFSNGKNDGGIGWRQAVEFHRALQETRRPHIFVWGQQGHGQRAALPISLSDRHMPLDLRIDQSQPAFTRCSLDDDPGNGDPQDGAAQGQSNLYLFWDTRDIVDTPDRWEMTVGLSDRAPQDSCTVDISPRRVQQFTPAAGAQVHWTNRSFAPLGATLSGTAVVDKRGLITLPDAKVGKGQNRITIEK
jgi:pimeloyl-ACP methyl ester carboxylesterase